MPARAAESGTLILIFDVGLDLLLWLVIIALDFQSIEIDFLFVHRTELDQLLQLISVERKKDKV